MLWEELNPYQNWGNETDWSVLRSIGFFPRTKSNSPILLIYDRSLCLDG